MKSMPAVLPYLTLTRGKLSNTSFLILKKMRTCKMQSVCIETVTKNIGINIMRVVRSYCSLY